MRKKGFFLRLAHLFRECVHIQAFLYQYFAAYPFGSKIFNPIGTRRYFQLVQLGLGTGSYAN